MSLSTALSNAISGLNTASRSAQVVSSNIANSLTEGYGRRELEMEARALQGGGVKATSIVRHRNMALVSDYRDAIGDQARHSETSRFYTKVEALVGTPDEPGSLSAKLSAFEGALVSAVSRPDLPARLDKAVTALSDVTNAFQSITRGIQDQRIKADKQIAETVDKVNSSLLQVQELNVQIASGSIGGRDVSSLIDHREKLISDISNWIPLKQMERPNQGVALYSTGGAVLLDGTAAQLGFARTNVIVPHMTQSAGLLSRLEINGEAVSTDAVTGPLRGGGLSSLFETRDVHATSAQGELDAMARSLIERFQDPSLDSTRLNGAAGLLTDMGGVFDAANEVGLAGRISINPVLDPAAGGESWRLRDGLGAASPGEAGNQALLQDYLDAATKSTLTASGSSIGGQNTLAELATNMIGGLTAKRLGAEQNLTFASTRASEAEAMLFEDGVDSDHEMQKLMMIEQVYSANARILQTVDEMMDALMRAV